MTNEQRMTPEVKAWLKSTADTPYTVEQGMSRVMARVPQTRQRGRWWPLPVFQRTSAPGARIHRGQLQPPPIATTFSHALTGRFHSMFSATKFIAASAVMALVGGFLLSAVLTQHPPHETVPAIGASASALVEPTTETITEPEPTLKSKPTDTLTRTDLLRGVDLEVVEVRPGIYRVDSDGEHDLRSNVWDVAVAPDGEVWVERHRVVYKPYRQWPIRSQWRDAHIQRLGEPGTSFQVEAHDLKTSGDPGRIRPHEVDLAVRNGSLIFGGSGIMRQLWDGQRWRLYDRADSKADLPCGEQVLGPEGTCWHDSGKPNKSGPWRVPEVRVDFTDGTRHLITRDDLGLGPDDYFGTNIALRDDGTIWTDVWELPSDSSLPPVFAGLATYSGDEWTLFETFAVPMAYVERLAFAPDGTVWVVGFTPESMATRDAQRTASTWDGEAWAHIGSLGSWQDALDIHFAPDGTVWFNPLTYFDGTTIRHLDIPASAPASDARIGSFSYAPDGSVWTVVVDMRTPAELGCEIRPKQCEGEADGLYVITPEAVAASE